MSGTSVRHNRYYLIEYKTPKMEFWDTFRYNEACSMVPQELYRDFIDGTRKQERNLGDDKDSFPTGHKALAFFRKLEEIDPLWWESHKMSTPEFRVLHYDVKTCIEDVSYG